jgi:pimeloyl-ACP methyl ester carboxylesterase
MSQTELRTIMLPITHHPSPITHHPSPITHQMPPIWFTKAIARVPESRFADVDGTAIHYLIWNADESHKPSLLFAHGFRAHARWWSFVAPFFLSRFRVAALDFSGMGDSGTREGYDADTFSRDILGVLEHSGFGRSTLVAHSFGGRRVARVCAEFPQVVERAIIIDSGFPLPEFERKLPPQFDVRPKKVYPTYEAARARFRLVPEHNAAAPYILDYVAQHSLQEVAGGWTWKFDDRFMPRFLNEDPDSVAAMLSRIQAPVTYMYGDLSVVAPRALSQAIVKHIPQCRGPVAIPQSHHHVMLDQPLSLVAALKAVLY